MTIKFDQFYAVRDLTKIIPGGPSLPTVWRWILRGTKRRPKLPSFLIGGRRLIKGADLIAWIDAGREAVPEVAPNPTALSEERKQRAELAKAKLAKWGIR